MFFLFIAFFSSSSSSSVISVRRIGRNNTFSLSRSLAHHGHTDLYTSVACSQIAASIFEAHFGVVAATQTNKQTVVAPK